MTQPFSRDVNQLLTDEAPRAVRRGLARLRSALNLVQVRLRLPIILIVAALVVGQWDLIRNYWDRLTRVVYPESIALQAVSSDTEYFCPMDPGVISDWPSKCGVCNMSLVRRKRGEAVSLPDGVVAQDAAFAEPNSTGRDPDRAGVIPPAGDRIRMRGAGDDRSRRTDRGLSKSLLRQGSWIAAGQAAEVVFPDMPGRDAFAGQVRSVTGETSGGWEHFGQ